MKITAIFVLLQYLAGFGFAIAGLYLLPDPGQGTLQTSIFYGFLSCFACMLSGVFLAGYFHLRQRGVLYKFRKAVAFSFAGFLIFLVLYVFAERFLPSGFWILGLFLPLTGAIFGFNWVATMTAGRESN